MNSVKASIVAILSVTSLSAEIVLNGVVANGDSYLVSLADTESAVSRWIPIGGVISGYTVIAFDAGSGRAKLKKGDEVIESALPKPQMKAPAVKMGATIPGPASFSGYSDSAPQKVEVFSSSGGGGAEACVAALTAAKESICIQALNNLPATLERALVAAGARGVKIEAVLDEPGPNELHGDLRRAAPTKVPVVIVVDEATVITGLLNVSKSVQDQQLEGLLVIRDKELAKTYLAELMRKRVGTKAKAPVREGS